MGHGLVLFLVVFCFFRVNGCTLISQAVLLAHGPTLFEKTRSKAYLPQFEPNGCDMIGLAVVVSCA